MYLNCNWNVFINYIFYNILKKMFKKLYFLNFNAFILFYNKFYINIKNFIKEFYTYLYIKNKWNINFLNINFLYTFNNSNFNSGSPYKRFYDSLNSDEENFFKFKYVLESENNCCDISNLRIWWKGVYDIFFFNYFFFFKLFFFKKNFNKFFKIFNLKLFKFNNFNFSYWIKKIIYFRRFIRMGGVREKIKFFRELSKRFWQTWLFYKFDHYIQIKRDWVYFFWPFFYWTKTNPLCFFYFFIVLFYSNFYWLFDWYNFRLKRWGLIFDFFFIYMLQKFNINLVWLYWYFYLFKNLICYIDHRISARKSVETVYGDFYSFDKLVIYFDNLMNDTTCIDKWLILNNLEGSKVSNFFVLVLSSFDGSFNLDRRPWHSFYNRFFELLIYLKSIKNKFNKIEKKLYRIFIIIFYFINNNMNKLRKKSFRKKPLRRGFKVYL